MGSRFTTAHQTDTPEPSQTFGFLRVHLTCPQVCGQVSTGSRGLSSHALKGLNVSQTHQGFQLDNVRGIVVPEGQFRFILSMVRVPMTPAGARFLQVPSNTFVVRGCSLHLETSPVPVCSQIVTWRTHTFDCKRASSGTMSPTDVSIPVHFKNVYDQIPR